MNLQYVNIDEIEKSWKTLTFFRDKNGAFFWVLIDGEVYEDLLEHLLKIVNYDELWSWLDYQIILWERGIFKTSFEKLDGVITPIINLYI